MGVSADLIVNAMLIIWNLGKPLMRAYTDDTYTDQTNQYGIHLECSLRLSTESPIVDIYQECALPFNTLSPIDDIIPDLT